MTANGNHKPFHTRSDGLVVRNVKRNVIGSRERQSIQTPLEGGGHDDSSYHPKKSEKKKETLKRNRYKITKSYQWAYIKQRLSGIANLRSHYAY